MKRGVEKWLNLLLAGALAASVLTGCGGSGSAVPAKEESAEPGQRILQLQILRLTIFWPKYRKKERS